MNSEFVAKSLRFHGQPLQKIWAGERGDHDLYQLGLTNPDYSVYLERQKNLTFQDRAKRLKLHQFLARNADNLFSRELQSASVNAGSDSIEHLQDVTDKIVPMPPYEFFLNTSNEDKSKVCHSTLDDVKPGHIVYGITTKAYATGMLIKVLCTRPPLVRYLADIHIKAQLPNNYMILPRDEKGNPKHFTTNQFVCCEVLDISVDADRMTLGMKGVLTKDSAAPLGLITSDQIPDYYRRIVPESDDNYMQYLRSSKIFNNTNCYETLYKEVGLDINDTFSHMKSLKYRYPPQDYAIELRQTQASKWAFRSVADGIEHFKIGRHVEAFQCLNKALSIDPRNVEGLVARGALYANKGSFLKAVEDFETALKLNAFHTNARKYMGETLVALGRSYEEENQLDDAVKAYKDCLNIIPNHEQARISLDALMRRPELSAPVIDINMLSIPAKYSAGSSELKKKKKNKHKSSSSSSSSDGSSDSESDSDSSDSSDSDSDKQKKKSRKQKSLSPFSKRMGDMNAGNVGSSMEFSQPFHMLPKDDKTDYNQMDDFLGADDDYETRVQKLIREASKHKKMREGKSSSKKKSKKKRKKAKKEAARLEKASKNINFENSQTPQKPPANVSDLNSSLEKYERSLMELKSLQRQKTPPIILNKIPVDLDNDEPPPAPSFNRTIAPRGESPVPPPPKSSKISIKIQNPGPSARQTVPPAPVPPTNMPPVGRPPIVDLKTNVQEGNSFKPFPIKAPVILDKFGCFRLAAPVLEKPKQVYSRSNIHNRSGSRSLSGSRSRSRSRSRSNSRSRSSSRSVDRRRRRSKSRTRRRSRSLGRRRSRTPRRRYNSRRRSGSRSRRSRSRRSRSRSRSGSRSRRRSNSRSRRSWSRRRSRSRGRRFSPRRSRRSPPRRRSRSNARRSPSPFDPNRRPRSISPARRRGRGSSPPSRVPQQTAKKFGNRVWQRSTDDEKSSASRWESKSETPSKNDDKSKPSSSGGAASSQNDKLAKEDGISLEEIDKIITQAKKERKEEILQRDKKILKKNSTSSFL